MNIIQTFRRLGQKSGWSKALSTQDAQMNIANKLYSKNITPDRETGIGNYTDAEIARALRYGVYPDGTVVFDFMPFHNMRDEDIIAVISYLRVQKPIRNEVPQHDLNVLGNAIALSKIA